MNSPPKERAAVLGPPIEETDYTNLSLPKHGASSRFMATRRRPTSTRVRSHRTSASLGSLRAPYRGCAPQIGERQMNSDIALAKQRLPLPALMRRLGVGDHAKKSARVSVSRRQTQFFSVWQNDDGWTFKCHAGCGAGDEINFLELHEKLSRRDAVKRFLELADLNGFAPYVPAPNETNQALGGFDWQACVGAFTHKHLQHLAKWRGFNPGLCSWLKQNGFVGLHNGCIAFPVPDASGNVVAAHYRLRGDDNEWRYYPNGIKTRPLVIGEISRR